MNQTMTMIIAVAIVGGLCFAGGYFLAGGSGGDSERDTRIYVAGSTTVQPLMDAWQVAYEKDNRVAFYVSGGGSDNGPDTLLNGTSNLGMRSSALSSYTTNTANIAKHGADKLSKLKEYVIAYDAVVIVLNADVTGVTNLTVQQLKDIFNGTYTNWSQVGGNSLAIKLVVRETGSGTRDSFDKMVMTGTTGSNTVLGSALPQSTTGAVMTTVKSTSGAIGYVNMDMIPSIEASGSGLKYVTIGGVKPTDATVQNQINGAAGDKYTLSRKLYVVTYDQPMAEVVDFLKWMYTDAAQKVVKDMGFVPLPSDIRTAELAKI